MHDVYALPFVGIAIGTKHHGAEGVGAHADAGSSERAIFHVSLLGLRLTLLTRAFCEAIGQATRLSSCNWRAAARSICVCTERSGHIAAISLAASITRLAF